MPNQADQLQALDLPMEIGFWPIAWGWWVLLVLLVCITLASTIWWKRNRYRFFAKKRLVAYFHDYNQTKNLHVYCQHAAYLLRELAITHYGRSTVSSLNGNEWIVFLNAKVKTPIFDEKTASYLTQAPFCDADYFNTHFTNVGVDQLHKQLLNWVRYHR